MADDYGNFLKRRALAFLDIARINFEKGYYDLVLFHLEQFLQLYLKYLLFRKIGDYPRTHPLTRLIKDVVKVYEKESVEKLLKDNMESWYLLEEAYITSRYLPRQYDKELAERMLKFAEKALRC